MKWNDFFCLIKNQGFARALKEVTKWDNIDYEIKWYRWLSKKYRWLFLLNIENIIWVLFIFTAIGALYAIRYRNRKVLLEWEAEERESLEIEDLESYTNRGMESNIEDN